MKAALGRHDTLPLRLSDIQHLPASALVAATTPQAGALLAALCSGRDDGAVQPRGLQSTITCERSFPGTRTLAVINGELQPLCQDLLRRVMEVCVATESHRCVHESGRPCRLRRMPNSMGACPARWF